MLLDDPMIKEFFGKGPCLGEPKIFQGDCKHKNCMALRVIEAMGQPIENGEYYLKLCDTGDVEMCDFPSNGCNTQLKKIFHPHFLRLPSRFQPSAKDDHNTKTCQQCESIDRYAKEQYQRARNMNTETSSCNHCWHLYQPKSMEVPDPSKMGLEQCCHCGIYNKPQHGKYL